MMKNYVLLRLRLDIIKSFLNHVVEETEKEIGAILARADEGDFAEFEDLDAALSDPYGRQDIAARAVYYEINALIEREIYRSVQEPWFEIDNHSHPKTLNELANGQGTRSLRLITDKPFGKIVKLIQNKYKFKIEDLDGADVFFEIREAVNAFKHTGGMVDFRKKELSEMRIGEMHIASTEKAYEAINKAYVFIHSLWKVTHQE